MITDNEIPTRAWWRPMYILAASFVAHPCFIVSGMVNITNFKAVFCFPFWSTFLPFGSFIGPLLMPRAFLISFMEV